MSQDNIIIACIQNAGQNTCTNKEHKKATFGTEVYKTKIHINIESEREKIMCLYHNNWLILNHLDYMSSECWKNQETLLYNSHFSNLSQNNISALR